MEITLSKLTLAELQNLNENVILEIKARRLRQAAEMRRELKVGDVVQFDGRRRGMQRIKIESFKGNCCIGGGWKVDMSLVSKVA